MLPNPIALPTTLDSSKNDDDDDRLLSLLEVDVDIDVVGGDGEGDSDINGSTTATAGVTADIIYGRNRIRINRLLLAFSSVSFLSFVHTRDLLTVYLYQTIADINMITLRIRRLYVLKAAVVDKIP